MKIDNFEHGSLSGQEFFKNNKVVHTQNTLKDDKQMMGTSTSRKASQQVFPSEFMVKQNGNDELDAPHKV